MDRWIEKWLCTDCEQEFTDPVGPQNRCHRCGGARTVLVTTSTLDLGDDGRAQHRERVDRR
jgi:DNA-directed RNA polymerase subunit RPC12/RpoP